MAATVPAPRIDWTGVFFAVALTIVIIFPLLVVGTWAFTNVWRYPGIYTLSKSGGEGNLLALHPTVKPVAMIAEKQIAARVQAEVKQLEDALLRDAVQVDEQIAAGDQVEMRERRVLDHVVRGEENHLAQLALHTVGVAIPHEEPAQPIV